MKKAPKLKMANGGMIKRADGSYSKRGLWDNIRDNAGSGKEPTKEMLQQEKKIKGEYSDGGKVSVSAGGEKHHIYKKESPTGNGKGVEGHIMVNHPTKDKGKWDTIDLTEKAGAKTVSEGVNATKKWHAENPYSHGGNVKKAPMMKMKNGGGIPAEKYSYNYNQPYASTEVIDKDPGEMETLQSSNARYEEAPNKNKSKIDRGYLDNSLVDVNRDIVTKEMGGIINTYKRGGTIHIKPENKGKFTATKKATGKSTEELTHSKNPITKKRAVFAKNAKKWKHSKRH